MTGGRVTPHQLAQALGLPQPTDEQAAVIAAPPGPTLVVAGAGAGKTETMAARVVWMVANRIVRPDEVLGLTFTRKAAQQLTTRIRTRLARLAGAPLLRELDPTGQLRGELTGAEPEISTYHSYAGRLLTEYGLLLPVEPSATLLTETQLWQLAHQVVRTWDGDLDTDRTPVSVTEAVLALSGQLAEHLVEPEELAEAHTELEKLVYTLPAGPRQRGGPSQTLLNIVQVQRERVALLPLVHELSEALRRRGALDFGAQMSLAARLAAEHPEVAAAERARFRLVLLDEYQDTGHAQRVLLAALFGAEHEHTAGAASGPGNTSTRPGAHDPDSDMQPQDGPWTHTDTRGPDSTRGAADVPSGPPPDTQARQAGATGHESGASESAGPMPYPAADGRVSASSPGNAAPSRGAGIDLRSGSSRADTASLRGAAQDAHFDPAIRNDESQRAGAHDPRRVRSTRDAPSSHVGSHADPGTPGAARRLAVTAVGDPMQSIYGWRGASAANLPRFATDFPSAPGVPAPTLALLTSWRNPPEALALANLVAEPLRRKAIEGGGVTVDALRAKPDAGPGVVALALAET
ncbi:UvrD-helicase domain-containing protein, partial [Nocardia amamiensis]|uniref:UvrD-helicase domain-containing protein n=1 Tax=Nocardia amamiensis TaxID=404578 RepID=UPI000AB988DE